MATISCTPASLAAAAKCFQCLPSEQKQWIDTYLLALIAGGSTDPNTLAKAAKGFQAIPPGMLRRIQAYLLCQVASGGGGGCDYQDMQVAWTPTNLKLGEMLGFFSFGDIGSITSITFNQATSIAGFDIEGTSTVTSMSWPNLVSVDPTNIQGGYFAVQNNTALTSVSLPVLVTLATVGSGPTISNNPLLTSFNAPVFVPINGSSPNFIGCALNAASINQILARCVANAGFVTGTVSLQAGTNAAPSGQGIADKAALILRGVTVNTN